MCVFVCVCSSVYVCVLYVYMVLYTYSYMYVPVHVCLCVQRPEVNISHLPPFLFIFEIGSLTELVAQKFTYTDYPSKFIDLSVFIHPLPPT